MSGYQFPTDLGQYLEVIVPLASAVALTTATPANVGSIVLTLPASSGQIADWDVQGVGILHPAGSTTITTVTMALSNTSATIADSVQPIGKSASDLWSSTSAVDLSFPTPVTRFNFGGSAAVPQPYGAVSTLTVYLVALVSFAVSTLSVYGIIRARRVVN